MRRLVTLATGHKAEVKTENGFISIYVPGVIVRIVENPADGAVMVPLLEGTYVEFVSNLPEG